MHIDCFLPAEALSSSSLFINLCSSLLTFFFFFPLEYPHFLMCLSLSAPESPVTRCPLIRAHGPWYHHTFDLPGLWVTPNSSINWGPSRVRAPRCWDEWERWGQGILQTLTYLTLSWYKGQWRGLKGNSGQCWMQKRERQKSKQPWEAGMDGGGTEEPQGRDKGQVTPPRWPCLLWLWVVVPDSARLQANKGSWPGGPPPLGL